MKFTDDDLRRLRKCCDNPLLTRARRLRLNVESVMFRLRQRARLQQRFKELMARFK